MMNNQLQITIPQDIVNRAQHLADALSKPVEDVLLEHLNTLTIDVSQLPDDIQGELNALQYLSDDALWTIAREQMPADEQKIAHRLMSKNTQGTITNDERIILETYVERSDRLMLRKAEAATILQKRGHIFTQADFKPNDG
jgi:hypothetical protein